MSDQTSPPGEPTRQPGTSAGSDADAAATGASPPPPPAPTDVGDAPPPPVPPKRSRTGLILALVAGLVAVALVAVVAVVLVVRAGEDEHSIIIPATAAGMKRDTDTEAKRKREISAAESQFRAQGQGQDVVYVKSGLYNQDDGKRGPKGPLLFLGAKVRSSDSNPTAFLNDLRRAAKANQLVVTNVPAGDAGGKAVCVTSAEPVLQPIVVCAWATHDTAGEIFPLVFGYRPEQLGKIMIELRDDVEKTE
jgi:hypothetical protein